MSPTRILLVLPLFLITTIPHAQQKRHRVGFVSVPQIVAAVPGGAAYLDLRKKVEADLSARAKTIDQLATKAGRTRTAADRQALTKAQQSLATSQKNYQTRLNTAFKPVASRVDSAVAAVAKSSGFTVVLDRDVAARSKLVVYANAATTDLTPAVVKAIKK
ncbi:OmpH family outer membrane protein [Deinococcus reticulitermitis]|nr:OmpH family outer membrane protein [Deinococcus reticulitermitis]